MIRLGLKSEDVVALSLVDLTVKTRPEVWAEPVMPRSKRPTELLGLGPLQLVAGCDEGFGEHLFVVESLEEAQDLWDAAAAGRFLEQPVWYSAALAFAAPEEVK